VMFLGGGGNKGSGWNGWGATGQLWGRNGAHFTCGKDTKEKKVRKGRELDLGCSTSETGGVRGVV